MHNVSKMTNRVRAQSPEHVLNERIDNAITNYYKTNAVAIWKPELEISLPFGDEYHREDQERLFDTSEHVFALWNTYFKTLFKKFRQPKFDDVFNIKIIDSDNDSTYDMQTKICHVQFYYINDSENRIESTYSFRNKDDQIWQRVRGDSYCVFIDDLFNQIQNANADCQWCLEISFQQNEYTSIKSTGSIQIGEVDSINNSIENSYLDLHTDSDFEIDEDGYVRFYIDNKSY